MEYRQEVNDSEETVEVKISPLPTPAASTAGLAQLQANLSRAPQCLKIHDTFGLTLNTHMISFTSLVVSIYQFLGYLLQ
ncbi:MAG: hypothetical protein AB2693_27035 [Candidatus Thiodiazotropha sp.]